MPTWTKPKPIETISSTCPTCNVTHRVPAAWKDDFGQDAHWLECPKCFDWETKQVGNTIVSCKRTD